MQYYTKLLNYLLKIFTPFPLFNFNNKIQLIHVKHSLKEIRLNSIRH